MSKLESHSYEQGAALSQQFVKQQYWNSAAMLLSAILAYLFTKSMPIMFDALAFPVAAATAFTVGVCCSPNAYRTRSGSWSMVIFLMVFMWAIPFVLFLVALWG
jgi:hypothetical protein